MVDAPILAAASDHAPVAEKNSKLTERTTARLK
jgi:hypothetical protein